MAGASGVTCVLVASGRKKTAKAVWPPRNHTQRAAGAHRRWALCNGLVLGGVSGVRTGGQASAGVLRGALL
eukprot:1229041-Prymnesium_polylepis.2